MTQDTKSISMAHRAALGCLALARRLSVVIMMVSIVALVAGSAGTSYAKKKKTTPEDKATEQKVVVTNFGSLFAGSVETFAAGSILTSAPTRNIIGPATLIGAGNGAAGDAQSSVDGDIVVTIPFGVPGLCPAGCVGVWSAGATGNSAADEFIGGPGGFDGTGPFGFPILANHTGLFLDQGAAFKNPFEDEEAVHNTSAPLSVASTTDVFAVANFGAVVIGRFGGDFEFCGVEENPEVSIGTVTEYASGPGNTGNIFPLFDALTLEVPFPPAAPSPFWSHSTIGGCDTLLFGPVSLAFDAFGHLFVVSELAVTGVPPHVTEYAPGAVGDATPIKVIGAFGATAGALIDPAYIAVSPEGDTIYVTDVGDNSIKIFGTGPTFGVLLGTIKGGHTKLSRPEGIALLGDDLYVVNHNTNSLLMFDDFTTAGGNIAPKVIVKGHASRMDFPVGVAAPQFPPSVL